MALREDGSTGFRDETIEGDGLRLRPLAEPDLSEIVEACNDPAVQRWLPLPSPYTQASARWFALEHAPGTQASGAGLERAIEVDGRLAGVVGFKSTDWQVGRTEIGYWSAPWARGRGVMTRAVCALVDWALDSQDIHRVEALVAPGNTASQAVIDRAGFRREGVLREAGHTHGGLVDLTISSRLASDPRPRA